jgi:predicted MFS family arabinose efflux permease
MQTITELRALPSGVWAIFVATLVNRMGMMVLPFLSLYLTRQLGYSVGWAGGILAAYGATALVMGPVAGRLADRWGNLRVLKLSLFLSAAVLLVFAVGSRLSFILVATIALAITSETFRPASLSVIGRLLPPHQKKLGFAAQRLAINLGMSVGPLLGGILIPISYSLLFVVDALTAVLAGSILVVSTRGWPDAARHAGPELDPPRSLLGDGIRDKRLLYFLFCVLPILMVFFQFQSTMPVFLVDDLKFREYQVGALVTLNTLLIVFAEIPLTVRSATWGNRRVLVFGALLFAVGFAMLGGVRSVFGVGASVAVWTLGEMLFFPRMLAHVAELAPEGKQGEYMGLYSMTFNAAFMLGPWFGSQIYERCGPLLLWGWSVALSLTSLTCLLLFPRSLRA